MINRRRHRVEVFVFGPNNTLLANLDFPDGFPELPGGGIDGRETVLQAAIRELREESGWIVEKPVVINTEKRPVFKGPENTWFTKEGWTEEEHHAVKCNAVIFKPGTEYGKEGDGKNFQLYPIDRIIRETQLSMQNNLEPRKYFGGEVRLDILRNLMNFNNTVSESTQMPLITQWR